MDTPRTRERPPQLRTVRAKTLDEQHMLRVFRRELPAMSDQPMRVVQCRIRPTARRNGTQGGRRRIVYRVTVEAPRGCRWDHIIVGTMPVSPDFLCPEVMHLCRATESHAAARPFTRLATYVDDLEMALLILPVDPSLPGLSEITGRQRGRLLSPYIQGWDEAAVVRRADWTMHRYIPARRCELAIVVGAEVGGRAVTRQVRVDVFSDDRGGLHHRNMQVVWSVARTARWLRLPEPLGYHPDHRLLFMSSHPERLLATWIKRLEHDRPLPDGVDLARVRHCIIMATRALVELQRADLPITQERTYRGELAQLHREVSHMHRAHGDAATAFEQLLESLGGQPIGEERLRPAHGRFRHERLAGDDGDLTILEWDGLCLASPALDAATFLGRLRRGPLLRPGHGHDLENLAHHFRHEFLRLDPGVSVEELAAYESLVLARHAVRVARRPRRRAGATTRRVARLIEAARQRLECPESPLPVSPGLCSVPVHGTSG